MTRLTGVRRLREASEALDSTAPQTYSQGYFNRISRSMSALTLVIIGHFLVRSQASTPLSPTARFVSSNAPANVLDSLASLTASATLKHLAVAVLLRRRFLEVEVGLRWRCAAKLLVPQLAILLQLMQLWSVVGRLEQVWDDSSGNATEDVGGNDTKVQTGSVLAACHPGSSDLEPCMSWTQIQWEIDISFSS